MQLKIHMLTIEDLVPADHLLRKIDAALDFSFFYEETSGLYQRPPAHRPGGTGKIPTGWLFVRHPIGASD